MSNALLALDAAISLTTLAIRATQAAAEINAVIHAARAEGRDITDAELTLARKNRETAHGQWKRRLEAMEPRR